MLALALAAALAAPPSALLGQSGAGAGAGPTVLQTLLELDGGSSLRYGIVTPAGSGDARASERPRALVVALHPGGRAEYYGSEFMQGIVEPALRSWGAVIVAPDVPGRSWTAPGAEQAVLALVEHVLVEHEIDRERILVVGFSMGGRGAWHLAARHPDVFTGAIVMAGSPGDDAGRLTSTPLYLIHSPDDEVVPFEPVEEAYRALAARSHPVEMRVLPGASHYMMGAYVPALRLAGEWIQGQWQEGAR